jgi:hypothetical protein
MTLAELIAVLPPKDDAPLYLPRHLLGAFRRKSITLCTGVTDETTVVYWFQSRSFTIDLRLSDGPETGVADRQGWIGDTVWDHGSQELSWRIATSYQPRNQWPEPARLAFMGNSVIEFAPSGAYVEDWRQQANRGPLLGLRLIAMAHADTDHEVAMDGGLVVAGNHMAFALSRSPEAVRRLGDVENLAQGLDEGGVAAVDVEDYEVSIAIDGATVSHSTQPTQLGQGMFAGDFSVEKEGTIVMTDMVDDHPRRLRFAVDVCWPDFTFGQATSTTAAARDWLARENAHLTRYAVRMR